MTKKLPIDWIVVTMIALIGVGCLYASHRMKNDLVQNNTATEQTANH